MNKDRVRPQFICKAISRKSIIPEYQRERSTICMPKRMMMMTPTVDDDEMRQGDSV